MNDNHNPFGYWLGRALAYLLITLVTLLVTGGGIALVKMLACYILG